MIQTAIENAAGSFPMHLACLSGNLDLVKYLVNERGMIQILMNICHELERLITHRRLKKCSHLEYPLLCGVGVGKNLICPVFTQEHSLLYYMGPSYVDWVELKG